MPASAHQAVFLSYASQDAEAARRICESLQAAEVEVWFDQSELVGGDAWDAKIRQQIRACALFIPVISAATQARREGYFRLEWKLGAQRTHMMAAGTPFLLPVLIDATPEADARVPDEFREVQWTRLPAGETPAVFAARVKQLCDDPESGTLPASNSREATANLATSSPAAPATPVQPFAFAGRNYANAALLATGLVQHWPEAVQRWTDGSIRDWVSENPANAPLVSTLRAVAQASDLDAGQALAVALLALNPNLPLIWQGEVITEAWLASRPELAGKLCASAVPEWLKKIRGDAWLSDRAAWRKRLLAEMPATNLTVDTALVERFIFGPVDAIEEQVGALFEAFSGATDPTIDALLNREELSLGEAILLLTIPRETFRRSDQITPVTASLSEVKSGGAAPPEESFVELRQLEGHTGPVHGVAFSAGVRWLASGGNDAQIVTWDPHAGQELRRMAGVESAVGCVAFGPDGRSLASGGADGSVRLWEVMIGRELRRLEGHEGLVSSVVFHPKNRQLASGGADRLVRLWDVWSGKEIRRLQGHDDWISGVAFSPDGRHLGTSSADHSVRLWDTESGRERRRCDGHAGTVHSVAFSPDGQWLASGGADHSVRLWDVVSGAELGRFTGNRRAALSVAFHPTKPWLASGGADHVVRFWDLASGRELQRLETHTGAVRCLAFSPDGRWLASGSSDHSVRVWKLIAADSMRS